MWRSKFLAAFHSVDRSSQADKIDLGIPSTLVQPCVAE